MSSDKSLDFWGFIKIPALALAWRLVVVSLVVLLVVVALGVGFTLARGSVAPMVPDNSALQNVTYKVADGLPEELVIADRPLFWSSRTPYEPAPKQKPKPAPKPPARNTDLDNVVLLGVFLTNDTASVVIKDEQDKMPLHRGDSYKSWTLVYVDSASARFVRSDTAESETPIEREVLIRQRDPLPSQWPGSSSLQTEDK